MRQIGGKYYSRKGLSIKQKVTIWYACMLVLIVLLLFGFILTISRNLLQRESDSRLEKIVLDFIDDIDFEYNWYELDDDVRFFEDGVIFSLYDEQGRLTAGSVPTDFPADTVLKAYSFQTFSAAGHNWSVYDAALPYGDGKILWIRGILQAETLFSVERTMFLVLLIACPLLIALALLVGYSITRRAFLPIEEIRRTAETIGAGSDLSARISTERTQGEIRQLAETFNEMLDITGVIVTKLDGDTRGGAALSVKYVTGKPIKFIGTGEKLDAIEPFYPDRMASRILGMGDVLSLIEKAEQNFDMKKAAELEEKLRKSRFTLTDYLEQMNQLKNMGSLESLIGMMPGISPAQLKDANFDEKLIAKTEAIILSMTPAEREKPEIISYSRKTRIAKGSGTSIEDVNRLLKQFDQTNKLMKQFAGGRGGKKFGKFGRLPF